jgi:hypothetical protein
VGRWARQRLLVVLWLALWSLDEARWLGSTLVELPCCLSGYPEPLPNRAERQSLAVSQFADKPLLIVIRVLFTQCFVLSTKETIDSQNSSRNCAGGDKPRTYSMRRRAAHTAQPHERRDRLGDTLPLHGIILREQKTRPRCVCSGRASAYSFVRVARNSCGIAVTSCQHLRAMHEPSLPSDGGLSAESR